MFGDLPRYEIVSAALRVTGKSDFLILKLFAHSLKESWPWGLICNVCHTLFSFYLIN